MKKLVWFVMVVGLIVCSGTNLNAGSFPSPGSAPVNVTSDPCCYHFAGITSATVTPSDAGLAALNRACQAEYGASARMCTTAEFLSSSAVNTSPSPLRAAWIQPIFTGAVYITATGFVLLIEGPTGQEVVDSYTGNCRSWQSGLGTVWGFTAAPNGIIQPFTCNIPRPVTCCTP